jgi:hypothetical protein
MMTCSMSRRYSPFVVLLLALVSYVVVGKGGRSTATNVRQLQQRETPVVINVDYARAASILDHYLHSDQAPPAVGTIATRKGGSSVSITEEPESHNLHTNSIENERNIERKREGTTKYGKNRNNKGAKGQKKGGAYVPSYSPSYDYTSKGRPPSMAPKQKSVKGEKSKEYGTGGNGDDDDGDVPSGDGDDDDGDGGKVHSGDGDDDDGDDDYRGDTNDTAPVDPLPLVPSAPSTTTTGNEAEPSKYIFVWLHDEQIFPRAVHSTFANTLLVLLATSDGTTPGDGSSIPHVSRVLPAFRVIYTVTDTGAPENVDYPELAALTRNFLHDTLDGYFASFNDVQYLGTELEFYFIRGVHVMEYIFKTKWGGGGNQVPSIPELNIVVKSVFDSNQQSYLDGMRTALRAENAFSTTTGITMGSQGSNGSVDDEGNDNSNNVPDDSALKEDEGSSSKISTKIIIPVSVVAGAAAILIVFVYFRRRKVSPTGRSAKSKEEEMSLKPDEDNTFNTAPMGSIQTSVSSSQRRPSEMMRHHSSYMESAMDQGLINQREEEFEEAPIDHLAEV